MEESCKLVAINTSTALLFQYNIINPKLSIIVESIQSHVKRKSLVINTLLNQASPMKSVERALLQTFFWNRKLDNLSLQQKGWLLPIHLWMKLQLKKKCVLAESRCKRGTGILSKNIGKNLWSGTKIYSSQGKDIKLCQIEQSRLVVQT